MKKTFQQWSDVEEYRVLVEFAEAAPGVGAWRAEAWRTTQAGARELAARVHSAPTREDAIARVLEAARKPAAAK
jgi:hypothetical protein